MATLNTGDVISRAQIKEQGDSSNMSSIAPPRIAGLKRALVVLAIVSSTFFYALDNTIMANIRPGIIGSLGHIEMLPWMTVAYPLGEVGSCPFW